MQFKTQGYELVDTGCIVVVLKQQAYPAVVELAKSWLQHRRHVQGNYCPMP
jgi:hypothetical protein